MIDLLAKRHMMMGVSEEFAYQDVTFINLINATAFGNKIRKDGGGFYQCNGDTSIEISEGDFWIKQTVDDISGQDRVMGISENYNTIETYNRFNIWFQPHINQMLIREYTTINYTHGSCGLNEYAEIKYESGEVKFYVNGILVYTSANIPVYPVRGVVFTRATGAFTYPMKIAN